VTTRRAAAVLTLALTIGACAPARVPRNPGSPAPQASLASDLDALFSTPPFDTALWSVRIERLQGGEVLYERNPRTLVMPASNMKIVTMAAAAETLGWDYRFETRLVAEGEIRDGVLHGDLRVIGSGDPSIAAHDHGAPPLFREWASVLRKAGITRVTGRLIGDDNAFDDETLGAGWAWDYLAYGYAAPVSALQYNEGVVVLRLQPGAKEGDPATLLASPPGHRLDIRSTVRTGAKDSSNGNVNLRRLPGERTLQVSGTVPLGGRPPVRTTSVDNPTLFFVTALRQALVESGVRVDGAALDIDDIDGSSSSSSSSSQFSKLIVVHGSAPLSELGAYFMKVSQNLYGETFLKAMGRTTGRPGSLATGRAVVRGVLEKWGIPPGTYALFDGSGLSRYNEISAWMITRILRQMYEDERHRGWFLAALPVGGHDGTLDRRMTDTELQGAVQAKTGTISNARALSGFLTAPSGERFIFSIVANNFLRPSSEVDAIAEGALRRVLQAAASAAPRAPAPPRR